MIPATFVALDRLPLNRSGKVDRRALPAPRWAGTEPVRPRDPREQAIADIWAEVLRVEDVMVHDDFFDLGGHSMLATKVIVRIEDVFGVRLPLRAVFEHRTVAELGAAVEAAIRTAIEAMSEEEIAEELR
jgi:acyl carrier protein